MMKTTKMILLPDASPPPPPTTPPLSSTRKMSITRLRQRRRRRRVDHGRYHGRGRGHGLRACWIVMVLSFSVSFWSSDDDNQPWPTTTTTAYAFPLIQSNRPSSFLPSVHRTSASLFTKSLSLYSSSMPSPSTPPLPSSSSSPTSSSATTMIAPDIMSILSSSSSSSAAVSSGGGADDDNVSPWAPGLWVLRLNFFGLDNTHNDKEDDENRAIRLAVSGVVLVSSNDVKIGTTKNDDNKRLFFGKRTTLSEIRTLTLEECQLLLENEQFSSNPQAVSILSKQVKQQGRPFGYINQNGQQFLNIEQQQQQQQQQQEEDGGGGSNGWAIDFPASSSPSTSYTSSASKNGKASTLRICLEVNNNNTNNKSNDGKTVASSSVIERGGVTILPSDHCQLFLTANVWRETALEAGQRQIVPLWNAARKAQSDLNQKLSHESGDRRLDGVDLVDTISAYGDMASLVWKRDETRSKLQDALRVYPPPPPPPPPPPTGGDNDGTDLPEGIWPGDIEWLSISDGGVDLNPIYMSPMTVNSQNQNNNNNNNNSNNVQLVGTWSAEPILPEGVYEEVE